MKQFLIMVFIGLMTLSAAAQTQQYYRELNGFKIGQYRETAKSEFGEPAQKNDFKDGFQSEVFLLKPDASLYMVFEYSKSQLDLISNIQITGTDSSAELGFQGLRFGMSKGEVLKILGEPTNKVDVGKFGVRWAYRKSNFSVEINLEGKLSSIKIQDNLPESYHTPDVKKLPKFDDVLKVLTSGNNNEIAKLLAPDMEISVNDSTLFFGTSFKKELATDRSEIFKTIKELAVDLKTVNTKNSAEYEENFRLTLGQDPKHVMKFKKGHRIKEIVFKYEWGQFLIWEVNTLSE